MASTAVSIRPRASRWGGGLPAQRQPFLHNAAEPLHNRKSDDKSSENDNEKKRINHFIHVERHASPALKKFVLAVPGYSTSRGVDGFHVVKPGLALERTD